MNLNDLLREKQIDPRNVLVMRHRPNEPELRKKLPWLAAERPDLFNAYQQTHGPRVEQALLGAQHVASFIGHEPGKAVFVGLYAIGESRPLSRDTFWQVPANAELRPLGMRGFAEEGDRGTVLWFDLLCTEFYSDWKGKLIVSWPPPERSWWRRAHKNTISIVAIHEESTLVKSVPNWEEMTIRWDELEFLPSTWKAKLSEWRAVYYIFDVSDGRGYVGSAYGEENLLGRWKNYESTGHGGNHLLRHRDPANFRFSILQRVSPDMTSEEVIRLERTWKERLHTQAPLGLNEN